MPRLLFCGDAIAATGFSRVTHSLLSRLDPDKWDITVLGINYFGDPHPYPFKIYPAITGGDVWGLGRIREVTEQVKPDVVVIFNDLWVVKKMAEQIKDIAPRIILYVPVDSTNFSAEMVSGLDGYELITYTKFGAQVLREAGYEGDIELLPHGVDQSLFYPVDRAKARRLGKGIAEDDFVVLNANRNQPRKRIDLTIKGFCAFARSRPNAKLFLHMGRKDLGWDIEQLFTIEAKRNGFDPQGRLINSGDLNLCDGGLPVEILNMIYNAADCHINTSEGEGWGLTSHEGAVCGVPQIVPGHSACQELFEGRGVIMPVYTHKYDMDTLREWGVVSMSSVSRSMEWVYNNPNTAKETALRAKEYLSQEKFTWQAIARKFEQILSA